MIRDVIFVDAPSTGDKSPDPEIVVFKIKNPLRQKRWETLLMDNEVRLRKEIHMWWLSWLRRLLPAHIYKKATSYDHQEFMEGCRYIAAHGIRFENPNDRSLDRNVYSEGRLVGIFRIELVQSL